jgi:hypothetical protein
VSLLSFKSFLTIAIVFAALSGSYCALTLDIKGLLKMLQELRWLLR